MVCFHACFLRVALLSTLVAANDFWSKVNDESIDDVMQNSPGFRQMIQSSCEMITLGRAGYPKNIPRETVDKLCLKMYPAFANKDQKQTTGSKRKPSEELSQMNTLILGVVIVGIVWYIWSASAPGEVRTAATPQAWAINQLAQDGTSPPAAATQPAFPGAGTVSAAAQSPVQTPVQTPVVPVSEAAPQAVSPSADQVLEQRRARLSRFDSEQS